MSKPEGIDRTDAQKGIQAHWAVVNRTYPNGETVTEFEFGNGVTIHYDPSVGGMYVYLPVRESVMSAGRSTKALREDTQILVNGDFIDGALTGIEIVRSERSVGEVQHP